MIRRFFLKSLFSGKVLKKFPQTPSKLLSRDGFTLIEAVIGIALWMILSAGVLFLLQFSAARGSEILARQRALENARVAMDGLIMNFQMAHHFTLITEGNTDVLSRLDLYSINPAGAPHTYEFHFAPHALNQNHGQFQRLRFGRRPSPQEFASGIAEIRIFPEGYRMRIIITTGCPEPIILEGSVCVRHK